MENNIIKKIEKSILEEPLNLAIDIAELVLMK